MIPAGGNRPPISLADVNAEFGYGANLGAYHGQRFYRSNNARGFFPASGPIALADFYDTGKNSPVVPGSRTITLSQNTTIPMFNNLTVTAYSGQGGQGGIDGNCAAAGYGGNGGYSYLADYVISDVGPGGANGGNFGTVSTSAVVLSITDENQNSIIPRYGQVKYALIGAGGAGGHTGYNQRVVTVCDAYKFVPGVGYVCTAQHQEYYCDIYTGVGANGAPGYVVMTWD